MQQQQIIRKKYDQNDFKKQCKELANLLLKKCIYFL